MCCLRARGKILWLIERHGVNCKFEMVKWLMKKFSAKEVEEGVPGEFKLL
jgi:hypothetical protein